MKLSRPVLAAATAGAIIAGSYTAADSTPVFAPLVEETTDTIADAGTPSETEADADTDAQDTTDEEASNEAPAADVEKPEADETAEGAEGAEGTQSADSADAPEGSDSEPNVADQPANPSEMRKLTKAPLQVGSKAAQSWFGATGVEAWEIWSESMNRWIPVGIIPATGPDKTTRIPNAPTLYMLNGAGGSEQNADWVHIGDAHKYFPGKGVNVVVPMEGAFSYYVDWLTDGDELKKKSPYFKGSQKWTTFLGRELREPVEGYLSADTSKRGVVGMSMSATSSLLLAQHYPGEYQAVGSFSGCAATSTPFPWTFASLTVNRAAYDPTFSSVTPADMWGPMGSPYNRYNDALVNAEKLKGSALYISNASGLASAEDMFGYRLNNGQNSMNAYTGSMTTTVEGGVIEAATNSCTHDLRAKLNSLDIPAHYEFKNAGTHSWPVWRDDMKRSWEKVIGPALLGDKFVAPSKEETVPESSSWNANKSSQ